MCGLNSFSTTTARLKSQNNYPVSHFVIEYAKPKNWRPLQDIFVLQGAPMLEFSGRFERKDKATTLRAVVNTCAATMRYTLFHAHFGENR
jgi:hypothetical protein